MRPSRRSFVLAMTCLPAAVLRADEADVAPPPTVDETLSVVAFGACHKLDRPFDVWDAILAQKPQAFLFTGDSIYKDTTVMEEKRAEYAKLAAVPNFARFRQRVPILATWDDHDYGANDGGADYPKRDEAKQVFLDFFREPKDSPRWKHGGVYGAWVFGPAGKRMTPSRAGSLQLARILSPNYDPRSAPTRARTTGDSRASRSRRLRKRRS